MIGCGDATGDEAVLHQNGKVLQGKLDVKQE